MTISYFSILISQILKLTLQFQFKINLYENICVIQHYVNTSVNIRSCHIGIQGFCDFMCEK